MRAAPPGTYIDHSNETQQFHNGERRVGGAEFAKREHCVKIEELRRVK